VCWNGRWRIADTARQLRPVPARALPATVVSTGLLPSKLTNLTNELRAHQPILEFVARRQFNKNPFDLVHDMSGTFWLYSGALDLPVLATLHLPRSFYPPQMFQSVPTNLSFNCVRVPNRVRLAICRA